MSTAAVPVAIDVLGGKQPVDRILEVGLRSAAGLHQRDAGGRMRDEDMAQSVAAVAAELVELASDVGDESGAGADVHDLGIHSAIMVAVGRAALGPNARWGTVHLLWLSARERAVA